MDRKFIILKEIDVKDGGVSMNEETLQLFKSLIDLPGAPGHEHPVRDFMKRELAKYADDVIQDNLGSVFGVKKAKVLRLW